MHLVLSSNSPYNTLYCNQAGQALFKTEAPRWSFLVLNVKVSRVVPSAQEDFFDTLIDHDPSFRDIFEPIGEIQYHFLKNSRIIYRGSDQILRRNKIFSCLGFSFYGSHRVFLGPDANEYIWKMRPNVCKLFLNNYEKTPVATFHRRHWRIFGPTSPPSLEIFPAGEHMVELILITFLYVEKLREKREQARSQGRLR